MIQVSKFVITITEKGILFLEFEIKVYAAKKYFNIVTRNRPLLVAQSNYRIRNDQFQHHKVNICVTIKLLRDEGTLHSIQVE